MFELFYIVKNIFFISLAIYSISLMWYSIGLLIHQSSIMESYLPPASIIIAVRNGENSLPRLINQLKNQDYQGSIEFIIVDDESNDQTKTLIQQICVEDNRFQYETSRNGAHYLKAKKKALDAGIKKSKHDILLFTDVDCQFGPKWAKTMIKYFKNADYVIGYSESIPNYTLTSKFQYIDFYMLMAATQGTTLLNYPLACSGQNHAYKKSLFLKVNGFKKIANDIGDDTLFLQLCIKNENPTIIFAEHKNSHVICRTENNLIPFLKQRIRWSGDANVMYKYNLFFYVIVLSTFITNIGILYTMPTLFLNIDYAHIYLSIMLCKFSPEFLLFMIANKKLNKTNRIFSFLFWFVMQPIYVLIMGILSFFSNQLSWKGRKK